MLKISLISILLCMSCVQESNNMVLDQGKQMDMMHLNVINAIDMEVMINDIDMEPIKTDAQLNHVGQAGTDDYIPEGCGEAAGTEYGGIDSVHPNDEMSDLGLDYE